MIKKIGLLFSVTLLMSSCYYDNKEELYGDFTPSACDTSLVTYNQDIKLIIGSNCTVCHSPSGGQQPDLSSIAQLNQWETQVLNRINLPEGNVQKMPPTGTLSNCDVSKIEQWYKIGLPE